MDETGADYIEWNKPERKTPILYTNTYIWNLEDNDNPVCEIAKETQMYRTVFWTLGEGKGGMIWKNSIETCLLSYWNRSPIQVWCMRQGS